MVVSGPPLVLILILLTAWLSLLCALAWRALQLQKSGLRSHLTIAGLGCSAVAIGAVLALHLTWISANLSQSFGVTTIRVLALFLFWSTLAGIVLNTAGVGRMRFVGLGTCLATALWWFALAMGSAISMGAPIARHPTKFLIPKGYIGWIKVEYQRNAPPLQMVDGRYVCRIQTVACWLPLLRSKKAGRKTNMFTTPMMAVPRFCPTLTGVEAG